MKQLITTAVIAFGFAATTTVHAAPASQISSFATKTYGKFKPGYSFSLKVSEVTVIKTAGSVPSSVPKFKKGQKITFKIGKKGELTGPNKVKIAFQGTSANINEYLSRGADPLKLTSSGRIVRDTKGRASQGVITFNINTLKNFTPNSYQVSYTMKK
ncbi:MAG: hypothetical protein EOP84_20970 [Verrucomicrobiaceae bacterium]|nr:MAG: hypothetical protein EOP84_20970 [Verrucomicrobiaceae bacterium]